MDAQTLLLTANTETVYAIAYLYLSEDGPTVVEVPPKMLGLAMDMLQRFLVDFGVLGPDHGQGGKYLFCRRDTKGSARGVLRGSFTHFRCQLWVTRLPG